MKIKITFDPDGSRAMSTCLSVTDMLERTRSAMDVRGVKRYLL
jgi:hypothetical protein